MMQNRTKLFAFVLACGLMSSLCLSGYADPGSLNGLVSSGAQSPVGEGNLDRGQGKGQWAQNHPNMANRLSHNSKNPRQPSMGDQMGAGRQERQEDRRIDRRVDRRADGLSGQGNGQGPRQWAQNGNPDRMQARDQGGFRGTANGDRASFGGGQANGQFGRTVGSRRRF